MDQIDLVDIMKRLNSFLYCGETEGRWKDLREDYSFVTYKGGSSLYRDLGDGYLYPEGGYIDPSNNVESFKIHLMEHINRWIEEENKRSFSCAW